MAGKVTILLADDHPLIRQGMKGFLTSVENFEVIGEADDGQQAFDMIADLKPQIALLDIRMPKIDGVTLVKKLSEAKLPTRCIMLTSYNAQQYVFAALRNGAKGYVLKTVDPKTLEQAINIVTYGGVYLDSEVSQSANAMEDLAENVSTRELDVLKAAAKGQSSKEISESLFISERTVQTHLSSIYEKLGAKNKTEAMLLAIKAGIVTLDELMDVEE